MTEHLQSGTHLDADQLAAFAEGALSERERQECLVHLGQCAACRQVAFLAQEPPPMPMAATAATARTATSTATAAPFWRTFLSLPYGLAALACALVVAVSLWAWYAGSGGGGTDTAVARAPTLPERAPFPLPSSAPPSPAVSPRAPESPGAPVAPTRERAPAALPGPARPGSHAPARAVVGSPAENAAPAAATGTGGRANAAGAAASTSGASTAVVANEALSQPSGTDAADGRGITTLRSLARAVPAPPAAPKELPSTDAAITVHMEHRATSPAGFAEVDGGVTDPAGAWIPGATVTLRGETGATARETRTDGTGHFSIAGLPAGLYELQITSPGFLAVSRRIALQASDVARLTSELPVGSVSQTVEVVSPALALQTELASVSTALRLPHGRAVAASVPAGDHVLALSDDGVLYLGKGKGTHWKKVKRPPPGKVARIAGGKAGVGFQATTDVGAVWTSSDGSHWKFP